MDSKYIVFSFNLFIQDVLMYLWVKIFKYEGFFFKSINYILIVKFIRYLFIPDELQADLAYS